MTHVRNGTHGTPIETRALTRGSEALDEQADAMETIAGAYTRSQPEEAAELLARARAWREYAQTLRRML